jgi:hypothetical protein
VEAALYYCCLDASTAQLDLDGDVLVLTLPGVGPPDEDVRDRVEAAGGSVLVSGQTLSVRLPAEAQTSESRSGPKVAFAT